MKTEYELEAPWQPIETVPRCVAINAMFPDGTIITYRYRDDETCNAIAWCPIVPPKVKRWRAEEGTRYYFVDYGCEVGDMFEGNSMGDRKAWLAGNYYRTREEAEAAAVRVRKAYLDGTIVAALNRME